MTEDSNLSIGVFALYAGANNSSETNSDPYQAIQYALYSVAKVARSSLSTGARAVDVVEAAVLALENVGCNNDSASNVQSSSEKDAVIVDGSTGRYGAVAGTTTADNPIRCARALLDSGRHPVMFGSAADELGKGEAPNIQQKEGTTNLDLPSQTQNVQAAQAVSALNAFGPIGAVALDIHGDLSAAASSGGMGHRTPGTVGDIAVFGAGVLANKNLAVVCAGNSEKLVHQMLANKIDALRSKHSLDRAVQDAVDQVTQESEPSFAVVSLDLGGQPVIHGNSGSFWTVATSEPVVRNPSIRQTHVFYEHDGKLAKISIYPPVPLSKNRQHEHHNTSPEQASALKSNSAKPANEKQVISVPYSWESPSDHAMAALQSPWYTTMFRMQSTMYHDAIEFFQRIQKYEYLVVPVTTSSISSPMGLGSDSEPLNIEMWGKHDYLADSQQFALEWGLRLQEGLRGVYYCGTSCRGEDSDAAHLNQFCHFECELPGELDDGIAVAEGYIVHTTRSLLRKYSKEITEVAGTTKHIEDVLHLRASLGGRFPRVPLDEALSLPEITSEMWRYVVPERPELGKALTRKGELMLIARYGGAVWLTEMHHQSVPFYQAYLDDEKTKACCADFLIGLGEILGCGARHETAERVLDSLARHEVDVNQYSWYVDMRKLKPMKTVGWGMGIERYLCWIMQHMDVRDIQVILRLKGTEYSP